MIHMLVKLKKCRSTGVSYGKVCEKKWGGNGWNGSKKNGVWEGTVRGYLPVGRALRLERLYDR